MKIKELLERAKQAKPVQLDSLPDAKAAVLLREAFRQIVEEIDATEDGVVNVGGLGRFRIRQVEVEREGVKVVVKRAVFQSARLAGKVE